MDKEIRGTNIILREQREEDAEFFAFWFNQPDIMFKCGFEKTVDEEKIKKILIFTINKKTPFGLQ